jgi:hypothetical protein
MRSPSVNETEPRGPVLRTEGIRDGEIGDGANLIDDNFLNKRLGPPALRSQLAAFFY